MPQLLVPFSMEGAMMRNLFRFSAFFQLSCDHQKKAEPSVGGDTAPHHKTVRLAINSSLALSSQSLTCLQKILCFLAQTTLRQFVVSHSFCLWLASTVIQSQLAFFSDCFRSFISCGARLRKRHRTWKVKLRGRTLRLANSSIHCA